MYVYAVGCSVVQRVKVRVQDIRRGLTIWEITATSRMIGIKVLGSYV